MVHGFDHPVLDRTTNTSHEHKKASSQPTGLGLYPGRPMLKADYNKAVALCKESIEGGFDLTTSHTSLEALPFDATQSLRRQMFSR